MSDLTTQQLENRISDIFAQFGMDNIKIFFNGDSEIAVHALMPTSDWHAEGVRFQADLVSDDDGLLRFYRILDPRTGETSKGWIVVSTEL